MDTNTIGSSQGPVGLQNKTEAEAQIAELYEQYERQISAYALRRTSAADASDVVAETFLTAWRRREDIPAEPKTLPWLYGVSRRVLANRRRSDERHKRLRDRLTREPSSENTPVTLIESSDAFGEVTNAIRALPDADAELLRLTAWEGLGPSDIAAMLGIEPAAARQRLFRARQRLTEQIDKQAADKERRSALRKVAAVIFALFLTGAGIAAAGLFSGGSTLETEIDQMENDEFVELDKDGDGQRVVIETDGDLPDAPVAGVVEIEEGTDVDSDQDVEQPATTEPVDEAAIDETEASEPDTEPQGSASPAPGIQQEPETQNISQAAAPAATATAGAGNSSDTSAAAIAAESANSAESSSVAFEAPDTLALVDDAVPTFLTADGPFVQGEDLFVFQLDFAARDDAHSTVANAEAVRAYGIDPIIVAGTAALDSNNSTRDYEDVMNATWGNDWFDAQNNRSAVVTAVADEWVATIIQGGDIWVAEGGVSDFTAEVLREVQERRPNLNTNNRVHVVHHNARNIDETVNADMALIEDKTDFIRIGDGNGDNSTADLNMMVNGFEAATRQSEFSDGWAAAFDLMPAEELDFSDTVTALYLLGIDKDELATAEDFQEMFLN